MWPVEPPFLGHPVCRFLFRDNIFPPQAARFPPINIDVWMVVSIGAQQVHQFSVPAKTSYAVYIQGRF